MRIIFAFLVLSSFSLHAQIQLPKAVVYGGIGACEEDCVAGAVEAAKIAGLSPVVVYPNTFDSNVLKDAAVWIQPGGKSKGAANAMGSKMLGQIRAFIKNGGGYVGFCAGAFLATSKIGTSWSNGLGIVPGRTILYKAKNYVTMEKINFVTSSGIKSRQIYWEGGPYFSLPKKSGVEVRATYAKTGQVSAIRTAYGKGRVAVTGDHPEAPQWWRDSSNLLDPDGTDYEITSEMIQWVISKK